MKPFKFPPVNGNMLNFKHIPRSFSLLLFLLLCATVHNAEVDRREDDAEESEEKRRCYGDVPSDLDYARLADKMSGRLVFPEPPSDYAKYNFQWNLRTKTFPFTLAVVANAEDIQEAILFARKHNLQVTVKSSGHDFLGRSSAHESFNINLMEMKAMTVTKERTVRSEYGEIKVETGATWAEIYEEVDKYDRVVVGGSAHNVTSGGYTMGGGHSPISRSLGLAVDNVLEIQVVLADGRISTCTENRTVHILPDGTEEIENNGDLFWALRGGGGGTFGVVVYYVFKLHQPPAAMVMVSVGIAFYINTTNELLARDVLNGFNTWVKSVPAHWGGYFLFNNIPVHIDASAETGFISWDLTGTISMVFNKFGPWDENTKTELQILYDLKAAYPDYVIPFSVENKTSFWDYEKNIKDEALGRVYTMGSLIPRENYNETLTEFFIDELLHKNEGVAIACTTTLLGGKVQDFSVTSSSVHPGFRSAQTWANCGVAVSAWWDFSLETYERQAELKDTAERFAAKLRKFGNGEYLNEGDADNPNWKLDFWGEHYPELLRIKVRYDPNNFFYCHHCVGSDHGSFSFTSTSAATRAGFTTVVMFLLCSILK